MFIFRKSKKYYKKSFIILTIALVFVKNKIKMIDKIRFKNFKIFKNWQTLELRSITILIGKNNSGKSAVLKLTTLIEGSLKPKTNKL